MKQYEIQEGRLVLTERPFSVLAPNHVRIRVYACGVNRGDLFQIQGLYHPPKGATEVPGLEVSGVVESVGESVDSSWLDKQVCALLEGGGYADYVDVAVEQILPVPDTLSMQEAGAICEVWATVWQNLYESQLLHPNRRILIHGGAGGIGSAAIQLASFYGMQIYTTVKDQAKAEYGQSLGATRPIIYPDEDFVSVIKEDTDSQGVDVVLDVVGGDYIQRNFSALAFGGIMLSLSFIHGAKANVNFAPVLMKNLTIQGMTLRDKPSLYKKKCLEGLQEHVWPLFSSGRFTAQLTKIFDFEQANEAIDYMAQSDRMGKIILQVRS